MYTPISSSDSRKKLIMDTFKSLYNCVKITCVAEDKEYFYGRCFQRKRHPKTLELLRGWNCIGQKTIVKSKLWSRDSESYGVGRNR